MISFSYTFSTSGFERVQEAKFRSYFAVQNFSDTDLFMCLGQEGANINEDNSIKFPVTEMIYESFQALSGDIWMKCKLGGRIVILTNER